MLDRFIRYVEEVIDKIGPILRPLAPHQLDYNQTHGVFQIGRARPRRHVQIVEYVHYLRFHVRFELLIELVPLEFDRVHNQLIAKVRQLERFALIGQIEAHLEQIGRRLFEIFNVVVGFLTHLRVQTRTVHADFPRLYQLIYLVIHFFSSFSV